MKSRSYRSLLSSTSLLACVAVAVPALAQQTGTAGGIGEIIVTAQRKSENVLSVPMSIQAVSGQQLEAMGVRDMADLGMTTPGYLPAESSGYTQVYVRGVGNNIFVGADPSVATFIDDIPRIFGIMVSNFVDVERVEILKGAQGGLYGRNATGGVVNIITRKPDTEKFSGAGHVLYGEKNTFELAAYANLPISDKVALLVAGQRSSHDPYIKNVGVSANPYTAAMFPGPGGAATAAALNSKVQPQAGYANQDFWAGDTKLLLKASDNFKITVGFDYNVKRDDAGSQLYDTSPAYQQAVLTGLFQSFGIATNFPAGFIVGNGPKFTVSQGQKNYVGLYDGGASVTAVYNAPGFDLTAISAYRFNRTNFSQDLGAASVPLVGVNPVQIHKHVYYEELRAVSTGEGKFHWLGGATYLQSRFEGHTYLDILPPFVAQELVSAAVDQVKNWSVYAQGDYDIAPQLNLMVSGRYIHESNHADYTAPVPGPYTLPVQKKFLPSATLSYKLDGDTLYARWARGYKAGGINPTVAPSVLPDPTQGGIFKGEEVDTFEVGYRGTTADRRLQFTTAAFYNDYKNLQVSAHANAAHPELILAIANAGSARTYGAEGSVTWKVAEPITIGAAAAYLNAKYKSFKITDATVLVPFNLSGTTMVNSPEWQISLNADLDQPIANNLRLVGNVVASHVSKVLWLQSGFPGVLPDVGDPGYWLTNARLGVRTADDKYGISVYANNLFNARYTTFGSSSAAAGNLLTWGNPRIIGGEIDVKF